MSRLSISSLAAAEFVPSEPETVATKTVPALFVPYLGENPFRGSSFPAGRLGHAPFKLPPYFEHEVWITKDAQNADGSFVYAPDALARVAQILHDDGRIPSLVLYGGENPFKTFNFPPGPLGHAPFKLPPYFEHEVWVTKVGVKPDGVTPLFEPFALQFVCTHLYHLGRIASLDVIFDGPNPFMAYNFPAGREGHAPFKIPPFNELEVWITRDGSNPDRTPVYNPGAVEIVVRELHNLRRVAQQWKPYQEAVAEVGRAGDVNSSGGGAESEFRFGGRAGGGYSSGGGTESGAAAGGEYSERRSPQCESFTRPARASSSYARPPPLFRGRLRTAYGVRPRGSDGGRGRREATRSRHREGQSQVGRSYASISRYEAIRKRAKRGDRK